MSGYGMRSHVRWNWQASYGTTITGSAQDMQVMGETLDYAPDDIIEKGMYGRIFENPHHVGKSMITGDLSMEAHPIPMGHFFLASFGQVTTTSGTNKQTHVFAPLAADWDGTSVLKPFTLEVNRDVGSAAVYGNLVASQLTLEAAHGEPVKLSISVLGGAFSRLAAGTPTFDSARPFLWGVSSVSLDGLAVKDFQNLTFKLDNKIETIWTLQNTLGPVGVKRTDKPSVELSGTMLFESHSFWLAYEQGSAMTFAANFVSGQGDNQLLMSIPALRFSKFNVANAGAGLVKVNFTGRALYHATSANIAAITLVNTKVYP